MGLSGLCNPGEWSPAAAIDSLCCRPAATLDVWQFSVPLNPLPRSPILVSARMSASQEGGKDRPQASTAARF